MPFCLFFSFKNRNQLFNECDLLIYDELVALTEIEKKLDGEKEQQILRYKNYLMETNND